MFTRHCTRDRHRLFLIIERAAIPVRALVGDEDGQDLIEYGLLSAFFGIVCIAVWLSIQGHLRDAYIGYDTNVQNLWASPNPGGS
jgi:Flp pilus assembly pilin Flp